MPIAENLLEWMVGRMDPAERREVMQKAVPRMLEGMSSQDVTALMSEMMPAIVKALKPEELGATMMQVMPRIVEGMTQEDVAAMISQVSPAMAKSAAQGKPEQKKRIVSSVVPEIVRACLETEGEEARIEAVREMLRQTADGCFAAASHEQKEKLFTGLHATLQELEAKHLKK